MNYDVGADGKSPMVASMIEASDELQRAIESACETHGTAVELDERVTLQRLLAARRNLQAAHVAFDATLDEIERLVAETA